MWQNHLLLIMCKQGIVPLSLIHFKIYVDCTKQTFSQDIETISENV